MPSKSKVKIKKSVASFVRDLNNDGLLQVDLRLGGVAEPLAALEEEDALDILSRLREEALEVEDPTAWVKKACAAKQRGSQCEEEEEVPQAEAHDDEDPGDADFEPEATRIESSSWDEHSQQEADVRDGDWIRGSPVRSERFFPHMSHSRPYGLASRKGKGKAGDWECPNCGDLQFARNAVCRRCGEDKPGGSGLMGRSASAMARPGDWLCPGCGDLQYARNSLCRLCQAPRPEDARRMHSAYAKPLKPGDWICPRCGDHQYGRNQVCRMCNMPKPIDDVEDHGSYDMGKPGDWRCPNCGDLQFARNLECRMCRTPRPVGAEALGKGRGRTAMKPGDWICPECGDMQFARNQECRKCGAPRPEEETHGESFSPENDVGEEEEEEEDSNEGPPAKKTRYR